VITYKPTTDLTTSAIITYDNMREYYDHYGVDWQPDKIQALIAELHNWDIGSDGSILGALRLAFNDDACYIRDLQVIKSYQNKGIGAQALSHCEYLAKQANATQLQLRVFKISAAYHLYKRVGFLVDKTDDNFYYMSRAISDSID
jgi:GNAT superfamily N-acetyltransferase